MKCPKCGGQIEEHSKVCPICGVQLVTSQENSSVTPTQPSGVAQPSNVAPTQSSGVAQPSCIAPTQSSGVAQPSSVMPNQPNGVAQSSNATPTQPSGAVKPAQKTTKNKNNKVLWIILGVVLVAIILFAVFQFLIKSPKEVFETAVDQVYHAVNDSVVKNVKTEKGTYSLKVNVDAKDAQAKQMLDFINKISLNGSYEVDNENMIMNMALRSKYDQATLLDMDFYMNEKKGYLYLPGVYNRYIETDVESTNTEKIDKEQLSIVLEESVKAFKKSLKDKYFISADTKISINGKEKKVKKITLELTESRVNEMTKVILTELKENDRFLTALSKVGNQSKEDIKSGLEESLADVDNTNSTNSGVYKFSLYTTGMNQNIVGYEIDGSDDESRQIMKIQVENDTYYYQFINDEDEVLNGSIEVKDDKKNGSNIIINASITNIADVKLEMGYTKEENVTVKAKEITNSINSEMLTENDNQLIMQGLLQNEGFIKLMNDIQKLSSPYGY